MFHSISKSPRLGSAAVRLGLGVSIACALSGCAGTDAASLIAPASPGQTDSTASIDRKPGAASAERDMDRGEQKSPTAAAKRPSADTPRLSEAKADFKAKGLDALARGEFDKAEQMLRKALDPKTPDWQTHSALGVTLASGGRHQEAQLQLAKALSLAPDHPSVLNNLALSYALDGKPDQAEQLLRRLAQSAEAAPQVRNNLALVVAARGQHQEAATIARSASESGKAKGNTDYLATLGKLSSSSIQGSATTPTREARSGRSIDADGQTTSFQLGGPKP